MLAHLTTVTRSVRAEGRSSKTELLVPPIVFVTGIVVGWASLSDSHVLGSGDWVTAKQSASADVLLHILGRNLSVLLLMFSGACTLGFSTVLGLGLLSTYVGATFGVAAANVGVADALSSVMLYAPVEFAGLLLAATAGLMPVTALVRAAFAESSRIRPVASYVAALRPALLYLCYSLVLIAVSGGIETVVILSR